MQLIPKLNTMPSPVVLECAKILAGKKFSIAFAESASAGRMAFEFAMVPESGKILKGGLVCYDAIVKEKVLGIDPGFIEKYTPESAEVSEKLAVQLKDLIPSDIQVGITGLTTPGGSETAEKPVGTIFLHILLKDRSIRIREVYKGNPEEIILQAIDEVGARLVKEIGSKK